MPRDAREESFALPTAAGRVVTPTDVGFKIAPLINAPGRLGTAQTALDLLLARDEDEARRLADRCHALNLERREVQQRVFEAACAQIDGSEEHAARVVTVVAGQGWHPGVVGIVAAKLVERHGRPAIVIGLQGEEGRGSARSPSGALHLYRALAACEDHLVRFGGHAAAAGLSIRADAVEEFARAFDAAARRIGDPDAGRGAHAPEAEVDLDEVDEALADELGRLGPFGMGNPEPLLLARGVCLDRTRVVGERHLQVTLRQGGSTRDGIAFGLAAQDPGPGAVVRAAFVPEMDTFRGLRRLRLRVRHLEAEAGATGPGAP
jgi:single-stranded-DNA-specific exonuclease